ncbi:MAG TPA: protein TolQ [Candidatus Deferrimicrobiaceae bacterium]|jgi:biopolymer transport protein TolQ
MFSFTLAAAAMPVTTAGMFDTEVFKHVMLAGPIVKLILLMLVLSSVVSWAVIFMKFKLFKGIEVQQRVFRKSFDDSKMSSLYEQVDSFERTPMSEVFRRGYVELTRIQRGRTEPGSPFPLENIGRTMRIAINEEIEQMESYLPFLATVGSASPFIGLFGTVWGIMNAFTGIAASGNATLSTVAPGIAEALVATAAGLAAAIPSVMAYNYFVNRVRLIATTLDGMAADFVNLVERKIERN